jgi:serine/threonine-protein kinase
MAEVFEAELAGELGFVRKVAIKRMLAEAAADRVGAQRFLDEARIASRLHHANIVSVIDVGLLDGLPFQVLELVDGIDAHYLTSRAGGTLPLEVALIIANDVAHALDHAHGARDANQLPLGIVHRDVKPSNVLVSWAGDVKLTDFGIAFAIERASKTEAGMVAGTLGFIAPEQRLRGELDGRTDVFALGLTLHALVTGYTPLRDVTVEMAAIDGQPIPVDAMIPEDVRQLIARAIAPNRRDRLTAAQFADAIGGVLAPRLQRDPRSYLRAFLAPLHDSKPKPGALDQLLGLDVVLTGDPASAEPARYELRETKLAGRPTEVATERAEADTVDAKPPKRRPSRAPVVIAAVAVLGAAGGVAYLALDRHEAVVARDAGAIAVVEQPRDAAPPHDAAPIVVEDAAVPIADARIGGHHGVYAVKPDAGIVAAPPSVGIGYVVVENAVGAAVYLDGKLIGYAPDTLEAPRGKHEIEVKARSGERIGGGAIEIDEYNTAAHPKHFVP